MSEDTEEGEIRPDAKNGEDLRSPEVEESPEEERLLVEERSTLRNHESSMHEEHRVPNQMTHSPRVINEVVGPNGVAGFTNPDDVDTVFPCGPNNSLAHGVPLQPNDFYSNLGPTPSNALGKRPRAFRSPPSSGSTQGPPHRLFSHNSQSAEDSIDLNSPVTLKSGNLDNMVAVEDENHGVFGLDRNSYPSHLSNLDPGDDTAVADSLDPEQQGGLNQEVEATVDVGLKVGIDLNGFEDVTRNLVIEDGVSNGLQ
ncbi:hypothetical protein HanHA300_Chr03g0089561 [Helianthus annuus]|nr:hypothetical protein HanHA300_Chr03g0089561 [Helianthus annuus]KAJ0600483.1 hypothetical protein HanIR_Chr03g0117081 [Helianthus annuus]KAJ0607820.1 hypothetical protein HanHA89_Chr03g0101181 [Helianthus annuus]KAJ0767885.1 hypothetical protein HanLR1_Chr03g0094561 [Helianthus annuus]